MTSAGVWMGVIAMAAIVTVGGLMTWAAIIADKHRPTA
jgi:hypothetical protein